jgi:hypothetical protein
MREYRLCILAALLTGTSQVRGQVVAGSDSGRPPPSLPDAPLAAQQQSATVPQTVPPLGETPEQQKARLHAEAAREVKQEETQRIAVVVPNFITVIDGKGVTLSASQKTHLAVKATLDPFNVVGAFLLAGYDELGDGYRGYGWGPGGYFKRVGANYLDVVDGTMLAGAVYPIILHQDPRYFRQGVGTIRSRVRHALLSPFICRGDNGHQQFNASNVLGNYTAGAISLAYYPAESRGPGLVLRGGSLVLVEGSLGNIGLEFAPDVTDWWHRRHEHASAPQVP